MRKFVFSVACLALVAAVTLVSVHGQDVTPKFNSSSMNPAVAKDIGVLVANMRDDAKWEKASRTLEVQFGSSCVTALRFAHDTCDNDKIQQRYDRLINRIQSSNDEILKLTLALRDDATWEKASKTLEFKHAVLALPVVYSARDTFTGKAMERCSQVITRIESNITKENPSGTKELP